MERLIEWRGNDATPDGTTRDKIWLSDCVSDPDLEFKLIWATMRGVDAVVAGCFSFAIHLG